MQNATRMLRAATVFCYFLEINFVNVMYFLDEFLLLQVMTGQSILCHNFFVTMANFQV